MPSTKNIKLGDEIEDIVSKVKGIAIGKVQYLDGTNFYIIQQPIGDDSVKPAEHYAPDNYCQRIGDGVYVKPKQAMGFVAPAERAG